jgi:hypothetical protein
VRTKKPRTPFVGLPDGTLLVECFIPFLILCCDGISTTFLGKSKAAMKRPYLKVDDAIAWCEKELPCLRKGGKEHTKYSQILEVLKRARDADAAGTMKTVDMN